MHYLFGSEDSLDYDILVIVDSLGSIKENKHYSELEHSNLSQFYTEKKLNINLGVLNDGHIVDTFKGPADEVNNSVFLTYDNHPQIFSLKIKELVPRHIDIKVVRVIRTLLSFISRTEHRPLVKEALRGTAQDRIKCLKSIDFSKISNLGEKNSNIIDFRKQIAFQLGQVIGLLSGVELYTKKDIGVTFKELNSMLYRIPDADPAPLEILKQEFLIRISSLSLPEYEVLKD